MTYVSKWRFDPRIGLSSQITALTKNKYSVLKQSLGFCYLMDSFETDCCWVNTKTDNLSIFMRKEVSVCRVEDIKSSRSTL